ncbi:MAG: ORF6N domain-containing protein [Mediterranea sp.]|jgi:phage regulator Rha-like protein|nr:ORF6N domain-containing protein [Mediterranea sp.]
MKNKSLIFSDVEKKIITIRNQQVILDSDVAILYGVETRDINKSVKNNMDKFPNGYIIELNDRELRDLRWNNSTANRSKVRFNPKAFTEKGLYMLATILKSPQATQTTIAIVEAFAKLRELSRIVSRLPEAIGEETQKSLATKSGELFSELLDDAQTVTDSETTIELNLAVIKVKHTETHQRGA